MHCYGARGRINPSDIVGKMTLGIIGHVAARGNGDLRGPKAGTMCRGCDGSVKV
jgi:hypothetical protein